MRNVTRFICLLVFFPKKSIFVSFFLLYFIIMIHHSTIVFVDFYQIKGRLLIFPFFSILRLCLIVVDIISQRRFLVAASCVDLGFSRYCYINQDTVRASPCQLVTEFWKRLTLMTVTRNRRSTKPSGSAPSSTLWRISFPSRANWKRLYSSKIWRPSSPVGAARRFPTPPPPSQKKKEIVLVLFQATGVSACGRRDRPRAARRRTGFGTT